MNVLIMGIPHHPNGFIERLTRGKIRLPQGHTLPVDVWEHRHRRVKQLLWLHAGGLPLFALYMGNALVESAAFGAPVAAIALLSKLSRDRRFRGAVAGSGLLAASALLVHASGSAVEAHFHFFVVIAVLSLYEDWIPFLLAAVYVAADHSLVGGHDDPIKWALVYGGFVSAAGLVNLVSWRMNEELRHQTVAESRRRAEAEAVAATLQQSLRPERLPAIERAELSARYIPAGSYAIGGDWYDVVERDGHTLVAIGDVAGHGVPAASSTAQLRHSFRAYALEGYSPAEIARRLDRLFDGDFATFACVAIDTERGRLSYANAGHLPPLVVRADGTTHFLDGVCPPLGAAVGTTFDEYEAVFEPGSTLLAYTDGLIERRGEPIRVGLDALERAAARKHENADELVAAVVTDLDPQGADDVAIVAFRSVADAPRASQRFAPHPGALAELALA